MARRGRLVVAMLAIGVVVSACQPSFPSGATLTATPLGPLVSLSWTDAVADDSGEVVDHYGIEVDGVEVATTSSAAASCVLTGLAAATTYTLAVTVYGTEGGWSGSYGVETMARASTTYTTPAAGDAGDQVACLSTTDGDSDRLPDAVETNDGQLTSAAATGTDPTRADTDGDGLRDGDEVLGTTAGLDLPAIGASAVRKDVLLEADWFDDANDCAAHSHRPTSAARNRLSTAFADAPVANPDGSTGINVVLDDGRGGALTGGNLVADADGVLSSGVSSTEYAALKNANFAANRNGYFHYILMPHRYNATSGSSGQAEINGDDLIVSLQCYGSTANVANTIMHELGHNLGLRHGGNVNTNRKPNYNSVMNYRYQFPGIDTDCDVSGDGVLAFSPGTRINLTETALLEAHGVCGPGTVALDWDGDASLDLGAVSVDVNGDGTKTTLTDWDDWASLGFGGIFDGDGAAVATEVITEQPVPRS